MSNHGRVTGLAHVGYGNDNAYELIDFYCDKLGIENKMSQDINHDYIGKINGVTGCPYNIAFVRAEGDEARLEFVGCVNAVRGNAIFPFGTGGHMHLVYLTDSATACRDRLEKAGVAIETPIATVDYGRHKGSRAFFIRDPNGLYVQIVGPDAPGAGRLVRLAGVSYTVTALGRTLSGFVKGMEKPVADIDIAGSAYLASLGGDLPRSAREVTLDEEMRFHIEILEAAKPNPATEEIWVNSLGDLHICVMVDDIQAVHDRMTGLGIRFVGPPSPVVLGVNKGAKAIFCKIDNEILVELFQGKPTAV